MGPVELQCGFFGARPFMLCLYLAQLINRTDALPVVIPVSVMKRELVSCPGVSSGAGHVDRICMVNGVCRAVYSDIEDC